MSSADTAGIFLREMWSILDGRNRHLDRLSFTAAGALPSVFPVSDLAAASIGSAGLAIAELVGTRSGHFPKLAVDRRLASFWFRTTLRPEGWSVPPVWDALAGDYAAADGWIRLHTNAPHHREAALAVLGPAADKDAVTRAVARWDADTLEAAVIERGGCAAVLRSLDHWRSHPQGQAVAAEPLLWREAADEGPKPAWPVPKDRPLQGIKVIDLTRVLAGPIATRFLAGFGADVLRIDPPSWDEPALVPEVTLGKRCARLDLTAPQDRAVFETLLSGADVFVHGYRPDALARLGYDADRRRQIRPGLVDVSLDAYGWTGPWRARRGFDSLVQMSAGIAHAGMTRLQRDRPAPLPVQALDHATGYLMAAAALRGLVERLVTGHGSQTRASLARTAVQLTSRWGDPAAPQPAAESSADLAEGTEVTSWGPARRLLPPLTIDGTCMAWSRPAAPLGSSPAAW